MLDQHHDPHGQRSHGLTTLAASPMSDRYRSLFDGSPDAVIIADATDRCVAANSAAELLLGYERDEMLGLERSEVIAWADGDCTPVGDTGQGSGVTQVRRKDGRSVTVDLWAMAVPDPPGTASIVFLRNRLNRNGTVHSGAGAAESDTSRTWADQEPQEPRETAHDASRALRESEERFRGAFDGASIGMAIVSLDGRFLQVNPALCGIVGYRSDELLAKSFRDITHPDDLAADQELAQQLLAGEIDTYQIEKRYVRKDEHSICGRLTVSLTRHTGNNSPYFVAQIQDVTPYKAAGAALREAEARYRTLVEQIPAAVYVDPGDALGSPVYVSPQVEALLGYSPEEWLSDPDLWARSLHPDDSERILTAIADAGDAEKTIHLEYRCFARDGREVWVHDQVALVRDEEGVGQYWQGFKVDVTDRKRAEEALRAAKEAAEEASRLKSAFLSMATHELRTPLTIISGYVELLGESAAAHLTPEEQEFLDIAQTGTKTLASLVDDLLDLARMEAGRLELVIRPVEVAEAIERVQRLVTAQALAKGIALDFAVAPDLPLVLVDLNRLVQVLLNLLGNAIKFTEKGSVHIAVQTGGQGVEIRVADTGIGISPEVLPRIFDEFRQADAGTTRKFGGSGLGLAIAKRLVEMQGGTITVESNVGAGSTFTVCLPAAESQPATVMT